MSLRANTYVAITGAVFMAVALLFGATVYAGRTWIHLSERHAAQLTMIQVSRSLQLNASGLSAAVSDWAHWDDTRDFAQDGNQEYVDDNLYEGVEVPLDINSIFILNSAGELVGGVEDAIFKQRPELAEAVFRAVRARDAGSSKAPEADASYRGVLQLDDGVIAVIAADKITGSDQKPPYYGTLVMVRVLDAARLASIGKVTGLDLASYEVDDPRLPAGVWDELNASPESTVVTHVVRPIDMTVFLRVDDLNGRAVAVLASPIEPGGYAISTRVLAALLGVMLVGGLMWAIIAFRTVDRASLRRIAWLRSAMSRISDSGQLDSRIALNEADQPDEAWLIATDVNDMLSALQHSQDQVLESEERHRVLVSSMADAVLIVEPGGHISFCNPQTEELLGIALTSIVGREAAALLSDESRGPVARVTDEIAAGETRGLVDVTFVRPDGRQIPIELSIAPINSSDRSHQSLQWVARDVTERRRFQDELVRMANHDHLTGLFNRRRFEEEVIQHMAEARRHGSPGALIWIDLDHFKDVNDAYGHRTGDGLLMHAASVLCEHVRGADICARIGGDEFAVLLPSCDREEAMTAAHRLLDRLISTPFSMDASSLRLSASVGVAMYPDHADTIDDLLLHADMAMYRAKEGGRNRICFYSPEADWPDRVGYRREWNERIERALAEGRIVPYAQPILDVRSSEIYAYELLARMLDDDGTVISPADFLPAAEETGLVSSIDRAMVEHAMRLSSEFAGQGKAPTLYCNISAKTILDTGFADFVKDQLHATRTNPSTIGFELTETAIVSSMARARELVESLRALGCRFALDDFGSGFASFAHLRHIPLDVLKIDGTLIRDIESTPKHEHMVRAIVELSRCLDMAVTAEFVETEEALNLLRGLGIDYAQGYHIGRPEATGGDHCLIRRWKEAS